MELLVALDAASWFRARITAVIPYYGYARQDRKSGPHAHLSKITGNLITSAGADRVLTIDLLLDKFKVSLIYH